MLALKCIWITIDSKVNTLFSIVLSFLSVHVVVNISSVFDLQAMAFLIDVWTWLQASGCFRYDNRRYPYAINTETKKNLYQTQRFQIVVRTQLVVMETGSNTQSKTLSSRS